MRIAMTLLALALATGACKKKENNTVTPPTGSGSAAMTGSADTGSAAMAGSGDTGSAAMAGSGDQGSGAMAGSGAGGADMAKKAGMCPSTVLGATTRVEVKGKAVNVIVSADDKDAIKAVQARAQELLKEKADKPSGAGHDQKGSKGGSGGICPVYVPEGATAKYSKLDAKLGDGAMITITPKDKPEDLKTEIEARIQKANDWVKANIKAGDDKNMGGVGGMKNQEGANHSGQGDGKGVERKAAGGGSGSGGGGGGGTGGGGGNGTGGGGGKGSGSGKGSAK